MTRAAALVAVLLLGAAGYAALQDEPETRNVILVTLDGLRWRELYAGADTALLHDPRFVRDTAALRAEFGQASPEERRRALFPFVWSTLAEGGQLHGNRARGSRAEVTNPHRFSYPGYNEILTGRADPRIASNDKLPNPNRTVLEIVNEHPGFRGRVAVFGSWDVFPYIVNEARSGVPVNAGYEPAAAPATEREAFLDRLQREIPGRWPAVRFDAFTHRYALEHLAKASPRLLYVAYGETDDFAHDGRYDEYLRAARRTDGFLRELWQWAQSREEYRDRTTLLVTTDHGRGVGAEWTSHGAQVAGAEETWMAVIGPDSPPLGERGAALVRQDQVAATVAALLGFDLPDRPPTGKPIGPVLGR